MSKIHSIAAQEKFNNKVIKFLKKLGAVSTNNPNYSDQYLIETIAGPLKVTLFPARESQIFSITTKFTDVPKVNEVRQASKLPYPGFLNNHSGKWNFLSTSEKRTFEEFTGSLKKIHTPGIDVTFTVRIKGDGVPEFVEGLGTGVLKQVTITYKVTEEDFNSPMCQMNIQETAQQMLQECCEVNIELGDTLPKTKKK